MAQVRIEFVQDYEIQDEHRGTDQATRYRKGETLSVGDASARHFVESKGVAQRLVKRKRAATEPAGPEDQPAAPAEPQAEPDA